MARLRVFPLFLGGLHVLLLSVNLRWVQYFLAVCAAFAPLVGVFVWGWSAREVVLIYWAENVIIGFWQLIKMLVVTLKKGEGNGEKSIFGAVFLMGFFSIHYGGFCAVHGVFALSLTGGGDVDMSFNESAKWWGPLIFLGLLLSIVRQVWEALPEAGLWSIVSLFAMRGLGVWQDFIAPGHWRRAELSKLMSEPYKHIIVLHVSIIAGAALVMAFQGAWPILILIVLGKLLMDIIQLRKASRSESSA